jgi:hypothetical protein
MAAYKNDYSKNEDYSLWELHQIRKSMTIDVNTIKDINMNAHKIIKNYNLKNVKVIKQI